MGFLQGLNRMIKGEPVFQPGDQNQDGKKPTGLPPEQSNAGTTGSSFGQSSFQSQTAASSSTASAPPQQVQQQGPKILPLAIIEKIECYLNGPNMDVHFAIQNNSSVMLELDKVRLLGTYKELDHQLRPGEEREFTVFSGPRPRNNSYTEVKLEYKNEQGDYFEARHMIEFQSQPDGTYSILRVRFIPPIRDV